MRKSFLVDNTPILVFNTKHLVDIKVFGIALTDYFYKQNGSEFPEILTKKQAITILKKQLKFFGQQGEYFDGFFDASYEDGEIRNNLFDKSKTWITNNYPYLNS